MPIKSFVGKKTKQNTVSELRVTFQVITNIDDKSTGTATVCLDCSNTCD